MSQAGRFFDGTPPPGMFIQTITGNAGGPVGPDGADNINLLGSGVVTVTGNPGTNTLTISVSGAVASSFPTDNGTAIPVAGILNVEGGMIAPNLFSNISTYADPNGSNNLKIALNNNIHLPTTDAGATVGVYYYDTDPFLHVFGTQNTFLGQEAGNFTLTTASLNVGVGPAALNFLTTGTSNTAVGNFTGFNITSGDDNSLYGDGAGGALTTGSFNDCFGAETASPNPGGLVTGSGNVIIGGGNNALGVIASAGSAYTAAESSNILIRNTGVNGENNTIRIGTSGVALGQQNRCFVAGISGVNPTTTNAAPVVIASDGQLGTLGTMTNGQVMIGSTGVDPVIATLTAGSGISIANGAGTITISSTGADLLAYTNVNTTPYVVLTTDEFLGVDCSGAPITIQLPNAPSTGRVFYIKDRTGSANTNNITVTTVGGAVNIDGSTSYTMNTQYASINVLFDGSTYQIW